MDLKKLLIPLGAFALALTGCSIDTGDGGDDGDGGTSGGGEHLPYDRDEIKNNLKTLGETDGFEITYGAVSDGETEVSDYVFGMKGNFAWQYRDEEKEAIKLVDDTLTAYSYSVENQEYTSIDLPNGRETWDTYITSYTLMFYIANTYDGMEGYHKVKDLTFAGRSASEYHFDYVMAGVGEAHLVTVIDKGVGITLFWDASGKTYDGEGGSASFRVSSFKTGSQVVPPVVE